MNALQQVARRSLWAAVGAAAILAAGCAGTYSPGVAERLSGTNEVPPLNTGASGTDDILVRVSKCPSTASSNSCPQIYGTVKTSGVEGTAAHIHQGKKGQNGPVIITLQKTGPNTWEVPPFTFLVDSQYAAYVDGELYVNVHSAANPNGEIRAQLKP